MNHPLGALLAAGLALAGCSTDPADPRDVPTDPCGHPSITGC